jgi:beta-lactamase regulating signal transducer with metallopeptidase domain
LLALAAGPVATVWLWPAPALPAAGLVGISGAPALAAVSGSARAAGSPAGETVSWLLQLEAGLCWWLAPWLAAAWAVGVGVCLLKLLRGCLWVRQLRRRGTEGVDPAWLRILDDLRLRLNVSRPVRLLKSALVEAPTVIGWLRPVILLPASALTGLTPEQLEAILAHELAHVRRLDCLVNVCQCALETLMFYHPAVWWISGCVREEREHCCDDLVVSVCSNRLAYARALAALAESNAALPGLAFAATGSPLLARIRRLVGAEGESGATGARQLAGLTLLTVSLPLILVGAWLLLAPPLFEATARLKLERGPEDRRSSMAGSLAPSYDPYLLETEAEVLQSELVLGRVVEALKLPRKWGMNSTNSELARVEAMRALKSRLSLRPVRNTMLIEIRARGRDGAEAAELANAVASAYRDYRDEGQDKLAGPGLESLLKDRRELAEQIDRARTNLAQLRQSLSVPVSMAGESAPQPALSAEAVQHLNALRLDAQAELFRARSLCLDLSNRPVEELVQVLPGAVQDNLLEHLLEQKTLTEQRLILLEQDHGTNQPEVVGARAAAADLQGKIQRRVEGIMEGLRVKVAGLERGLTKLDDQLSKAKEEDLRLAARTMPYWDAKRSLEDKIRFRTELEKRIASERALPKGVMVTVIDPAFRPPRANTPNRPLGGALIGCGLLLDLVGAVLMRPRRRP